VDAEQIRQYSGDHHALLFQPPQEYRGVFGDHMHLSLLFDLRHQPHGGQSVQNLVCVAAADPRLCGDSRHRRIPQLQRSKVKVCAAAIDAEFAQYLFDVH